MGFNEGWGGELIQVWLKTKYGQLLDSEKVFINLQPADIVLMLCILLLSEVEGGPFIIVPSPQKSAFSKLVGLCSIRHTRSFPSPRWFHVKF